MLDNYDREESYIPDFAYKGIVSLGVCICMRHAARYPLVKFS